jgi:hypothetical protein
MGARAGILTAGAKAFPIEQSVKPSPPVTGDLIIRNFAANNIVSKGLVERIEIRKAP